MNPYSIGALIGELGETYWAPTREFKTRATVELTRHHPCIDERVWLGTNCKGNWKVGVTLDRHSECVATGAYKIGIIYYYRIEFEDKNDALLFKLTYGGA